MRVIRLWVIIIISFKQTPSFMLNYHLSSVEVKNKLSMRKSNFLPEVNKKMHKSSYLRN